MVEGGWWLGVPPCGGRRVMMVCACECAGARACCERAQPQSDAAGGRATFWLARGHSSLCLDYGTVPEVTVLYNGDRIRSSDAKKMEINPVRDEATQALSSPRG